MDRRIIVRVYLLIYFWSFEANWLSIPIGILQTRLKIWLFLYCICPLFINHRVMVDTMRLGQGRKYFRVGNFRQLYIGDLCISLALLIIWNRKWSLTIYRLTLIYYINVNFTITSKDEVSNITYRYKETIKREKIEKKIKKQCNHK